MNGYKYLMSVSLAALAACSAEIKSGAPDIKALNPADSPAPTVDADDQQNDQPSVVQSVVGLWGGSATLKPAWGDDFKCRVQAELSSQGGQLVVRKFDYVDCKDVSGGENEYVFERPIELSIGNPILSQENGRELLLQGKLAGSTHADLQWINVNARIDSNVQMTLSLTAVESQLNINEHSLSAQGISIYQVKNTRLNRLAK
jgi:hypothetical protein